MLDALLAMQRVATEDAMKTWQRWLPAAGDVTPGTSRPRLTSPSHVVYQEHTLRLLRYQGNRPVRFATPVLICFGLVNRPYILDLQPNRSVVRRLLDAGFDVYLIDWGVPTAADRSLRLEDYIERFLSNVVQHVCAQTGQGRVHLFGYCMGGTMATMFAALHPEVVQNLILLATPIDFHTGDGPLRSWSRPEYFDVDAFIDTYGNCPGSFLQACFQLLKPYENLYEKYATLFERRQDERFLENFLAMERWGNDNIPVAGETFRQFVKMLYQQNALVHGQMVLGGRSVDLRQIACPILLLVAAHDHLVPPTATMSLLQYVSSSDVRSITVDSGHVGLVVGSKAHQELWPAALAWIADRTVPHAGEVSPNNQSDSGKDGAG